MGKKVVGFVTLAWLVGAATVGAQEVHFTGSTSGCFYSGSACTPDGSSTTPTNDGHALTYVGSTFDAFTSDGYLGIGSAASTPNFNNLGSFELANMSYNYSANPTFFVFQTMFTSPTAATATFSAAVKGSVRSDGAGGVTIDFDNTPQVFNYAGGSFTYSLNDLAITNGHVVEVTGQIETTVSTVPEPSSMALLGTGLVGLVPMMRRRTR